MAKKKARTIRGDGAQAERFIAEMKRCLQGLFEEAMNESGMTAYDVSAAWDYIYDSAVDDVRFGRHIPPITTLIRLFNIMGYTLHLELSPINCVAKNGGE